MLSAADFAQFIGVSRESVRTKYQRNEVLGLKGAKRGLRYPKWQVTSDGGLLPELPRLFEVLGGESWTVYRFLTQHHPELEGDTALSVLQRGNVEKVPCCRRKYRWRFFLICGSPVASKGINNKEIHTNRRSSGNSSSNTAASRHVLIADTSRNLTIFITNLYEENCDNPLGIGIRRAFVCPGR
jgi:hypothetical protein